MKLAIMQPYLFPYAGYFQLLAAVDKFVFYDDVNYIKGGWINRNRLLLAGEPRYFTIPLLGASPFRRICEVEVQPPETWRRRVLESIRQSYSRAPYFAQVFDLVADVLSAQTTHIGEIAKRSIEMVAKYLDLTPDIVWTSVAYANDGLKSVERVLDICHREQASSYYNLPGGSSLYNADAFAAAGLELRFIEPHLHPYRQNSDKFHPALSIIDVLMWNDRQAVLAMIGMSKMEHDVRVAIE